MLPSFRLWISINIIDSLLRIRFIYKIQTFCTFSFVYLLIALQNIKGFWSISTWPIVDSLKYWVIIEEFGLLINSRLKIHKPFEHKLQKKKTYLLSRRFIQNRMNTAFHKFHQFYSKKKLLKNLTCVQHILTKKTSKVLASNNLTWIRWSRCFTKTCKYHKSHKCIYLLIRRVFWPHMFQLESRDEFYT